MTKQSPIIYILILSGLINACSDQAIQESTSEQNDESLNVIGLSKEQFEKSGIQLVQAKKQIMSEQIKASGQLGLPPANQQRISIPLGGWIVACDLLPGSHVSKGDILLEVRSPQYLQIQQEYLEINATLPYLKSERDRQEALLTKEVGSKREFEKAQADYETALAKQSGLESKLRFIGIDPESLSKSKKLSEQIKIRSKIHGYVGEIHARIGDYMTENESVMEIMDLSHLHVELKVFEKDISKIREGQQLEVWVNYADEPVKAEVYLIGKSLGSDKTVDVHCHLLKEEKYYLPGMYVEANISLNQDAQWTLPNKALHLKEGSYKSFVLLDSNDAGYRFQMIDIKFLRANGEYSSVELDTLKTYASSGSFALYSGLHNTEEEE